MPTGRRWEDFAARWLGRRGLTLLARNVRSRWGEIDLVMLHASTLVFVEVRYRRDASRGGSFGAITAAKQTRIRRTASVWLAGHPEHTQRGCRFDALVLTGDPAQPDCRWIRQAFTD